MKFSVRRRFRGKSESAASQVLQRGRNVVANVLAGARDEGERNVVYGSMLRRVHELLRVLSGVKESLPK